MTADTREELLIEAFLAAEFGFTPPCLCLPARSSDHDPRCPLAPDDGEALRGTNTGVR